MSIIKSLLPQQIASGLGDFKKKIKYRGRKRFCPVCSCNSCRFEVAGAIPREDAQCVWCGGLERHRLLWLFLQRKTDFFSGNPEKRMLHVAPESCLRSRFRQTIGKGYMTADLFAEDVDVKMDICDIRFADETFDIVYCSHVLEHVPDDRKAMREFRRVMKPQGWAILLVPITVQQTVEDPSIIDPKERLRLFGQEDHVRRYGLDYVERLKISGLAVKKVLPDDFLSNDDILLMGITQAAGEIYFCRPR